MASGGARNRRWPIVVAGLIAALCLAVGVMVQTGFIWVKVDMPPGAPAVSLLYVDAWLIIDLSAVVIAGVTAVRLALRLVRRLRSNRSAAGG